MDQFTRSILLMFVLLNPFILSVYLIDVIRDLTFPILARHLIRAAIVSLVAFWTFAILGDAVFEDVLQLRFPSFLIFGGVTFLIIGIRLILGGGPPMEGLRPDSAGISGAIAMPLMIGPGTISASVVTGSRLPQGQAILSILIAVVAMTVSILVFKMVHDYVRDRNEPLVHKYLEVAGRMTTLFTGSFAIEKNMNGLQGWLQIFATT